MARFTEDEATRAQMAALGEALAGLRRDAGLSQAEAGARAGMTSQGWGLYEAGRRAGLFRPDVQRRLTAALGATPETLAFRAAPRLAGDAPEAPAASGVASGGRGFGHGAPPETTELILTHDLAPWAETGVRLLWRADRAPRPGQGCVVALDRGAPIIGLFESRDASGVRLRHPRTGVVALVRADRIRSFGAVMARLEAESET